MAEEFKGLGNEALRNVQGVRDTMREVDLAVRDLNKQLRQSGQDAATVSTEFRDLSNSADKFAKLQEQASKSSKTTADAIKEQQKQLNIVRSLNVRIDDLYKQAAIANKSIDQDSAQIAFNLKKQAENLANARDNAKVLANEYGTLAEDSAKLDKSTQFFSNLSKIASNIPILGKFSKPFQDAAEAARKQTLENAKAANLKEKISKLSADELKTGKGLGAARIKELGLEDIVGKKRGKAAAEALKVAQATTQTSSAASAGFKALGSNMSKANIYVMAALALYKGIQAFIEVSFAADKRVTDIAKNLSIGKEGARGIYSNILSLKPELNTVYATSENIVNAFNELTQLTDFAVLGTKEQLETQIKLTKELGLSTDEALALQSIFAVNNVEADQGLDIINDQIAAFANENKLLADSSKITKQIQGTSKLIQLNFKGNLDALVKTVLQANKLGLSLDQVNKIAGSLLDFEQSIEAELTAELLTGKQLNLDKARQFALTNDIAGLTEEIKKQGLDQLFLNAKTRIEQEAIAQTIGMTADSMGDMVYKSQLIDKVAGDYTKKLRDNADLLERQGDLDEAKVLRDRASQIEQGVFEGKSLEAAKAQVSAQEKFNIQLERAKEIFTDVVSGGLLDGLVDAIEDIVLGLEKLGFGNREARLAREQQKAQQIQEQQGKTFDAEEFKRLQEVASTNIGPLGFAFTGGKLLGGFSTESEVEAAKARLQELRSEAPLRTPQTTASTSSPQGTNMMSGPNPQNQSIIIQNNITMDGEKVASNMNTLPMPV
jgi:hypothetical protein